jgi:hypothetical protein
MLTGCGHDPEDSPGFSRRNDGADGRRGLGREQLDRAFVGGEQPRGLVHDPIEDRLQLGIRGDDLGQLRHELKLGLKAPDVRRPGHARDVRHGGLSKSGGARRSAV